MPYVWDDQDYLWVDDRQEYDKNQFVVVRKVFIKPKHDNPEVGDSFISQKSLNLHVHY